MSTPHDMTSHPLIMWNVVRKMVLTNHHRLCLAFIQYFLLHFWGIYINAKSRGMILNLSFSSTCVLCVRAREREIRASNVVLSLSRLCCKRWGKDLCLPMRTTMPRQFPFSCINLLKQSSMKTALAVFFASGSLLPKVHQERSFLLLHSLSFATVRGFLICTSVCVCESRNDDYYRFSRAG